MVAEYTSSYVFAGSTSFTETGLLWVKEWPCHGLRRTVAKGRNFVSSGRASKFHQETFRSCVCSVQVCGLAGVWNFRFGDIPQAKVFFKGPKQAWRGRPHFDGLEHCGHRKLQLSYPWRSDPRPWRQRRYWLSSKSRLNQGGLRDYFYSKKKSSKSPQRKRKEKESKRENEWKKEKKKKATTTKTTRKCAEITSIVNKCMTSATEILPPRERCQSKRSLQSSGRTFFSVCETQLNRRKKKTKKGNSWNVERLTQQQQQSFVVHSACTRTMAGPAIEIDDLWSIATCQARKKDNP